VKKEEPHIASAVQMLLVLLYIGVHTGRSKTSYTAIILVWFVQRSTALQAGRSRVRFLI
jgi:hypothetical protein